MMRWILLVLTGVLAVTAEVTLFERLSVAGVRPDAALAVALLAALAARDTALAGSAAWTVGFLTDFASGGRLGAFALCFLAAGLIAHALRRVIAGDTAIGQIVLISLLALLVNAVDGAGAAMRSPGVGAARIVAHALGTAAYTAVLVPVLALLGRPVWARFGNRKT